MCCLSDNVQVKYRSKVVKYAWPMPHHDADFIPWVQVTLASGVTLQTKLLVSLIPSHQLYWFSVLVCFGFCYFYSPHLFSRLVLMDQTPWLGESWEYPQSNGIMTNLLWLLYCTCQR